MRKSNVLPLMTRKQSVGCFQTYHEAKQTYEKTKAEVDTFLKRKEPVPAALVESLNKNHQVCDQQRNTLMVANMRLVFSICSHYTGRGVDSDDIIQEATLGLMKAVERFDPRLGNSFSTYASWWIRCFAGKGVQYQSNMRVTQVPDNRLAREQTLMREIDAFQSKHGYSPSDEELIMSTARATIKKLSKRQLQLLRANPSTGKTISFEAPISENDARAFGQRLCGSEPSPETLVMTMQGLTELKQEIYKVLTIADPRKSNPERNNVIMRMRFGFHSEMSRMPLKNIGDKVGITRERTRQIIEARLAYHGYTECLFILKLDNMMTLLEAVSDIG